MAETALSIARSVLGSVIGKAAAAAAEEMSLLMGVQKEMWFMKDELKTMQSFLIAAESMKNKMPLVKVWGEQVRSLSYDIEDCLDEFMVHVGSQRLSHQLRKLKDRHRIAIQIRDLKTRVEEVSSRNTRYNLIEMRNANNDEAHSYMEDVRNCSARNIDEEKLVGTSTFKKKLLDKINTHYDDGHDRVICVVGMGGLGKTTIVRKIYESKEGIENKFPYRAWITVSQSFSRIDMLKDVIKKLFSDESLTSCLKSLDGKAAMEVQVDHLATYLIEELKEKRYFVVLDDLWTIDAWIWIRDICLPGNNNKDSRIVITTRNVSVAESCTTKFDIKPFILELEPLEKKHSKDLLLRKMRKSEQDMENDEKLKTIVTKLVTKCGGLPLAIVTIGALFSTKHESEWDKLYTQLPAELENNLSLGAIRSMVTLSYNHLPSHLKPCFLYLSIFPEDFEVTRTRLVNRWIAEGLVRAHAGMTLKDVGKSYFNELINRSMIQPSIVNLEGTVKSCRVHDIMRDIIMSLSREDGFVYTSSDNGPGLLEDNFRHVALYDSKNCSIVGMDWSRVRSLTVFGNRSTHHGASLCSPQLRMLRTLDLANIEFSITQKEVNYIGLLRHLKYVTIWCYKEISTIYSLPRSIGKLQGLQVLNIRGSYISTLPTEIYKLQRLHTLCCDKYGTYDIFDPRKPMKCMMKLLWLPIMFTPFVDSKVRNQANAELHMAYSTCWSKSKGLKVPRGIGNLKELHILRVVSIKRTSSKAIIELGELTKLRQLSVDIQGATEKKCMTLWKTIQKLYSLSSLSIRADDGRVEWASSASCPPSLRSLTLWGRIGDKVDLFMNLTHLVKLHMGFSKLEEGRAAEILGALPNLMLLELYKAAYAGKELVFRQGVFLNLRKVYIWAPTQLREIRFEQGGSPQMESIRVGDCRLELGINGIKNLPKLKEVSLWYKSKVARMGMLQNDVNTHPNEPILRLHDDPSDHDLGDLEGASEYFDTAESLPVGDHDGEGSEVPTTTAGDRSVLQGSSSRLFHSQVL